MLKRASTVQRWAAPKNYQYMLINVWADVHLREEHAVKLIEGGHITDLQKLASNPVFKEIHDRLLVLAQKEQKELANSWLWSNKFTKQMGYRIQFQFLIYLLFLSPFVFFIRDRLYTQYIKHKRKIELGEKIGIDFNDIASYPNSAFELLKEQRLQDRYLERKDKQIDNTEKLFKEYQESRLTELSRIRKETGLN